MQSNKLLNALGLCRKAGALVMGFDPAKENVLKGKAYMVLVASDLSEKTLKRVNYFCEDITEVYSLPFTQQQLLDITRKPTGVLAVIDENLAKLVEKNIQED